MNGSRVHLQVPGGHGSDPLTLIALILLPQTINRF